MNKKKILVVEDERLIAEDIKRTLSYLKYDVVDTISSGEKAIIKAQELKPDLILMDIMLEDKITGIQAAEKIHQKSQIPIIFLTAYSQDKTIQEAIVAEPYGYILKPFEERELHATIEMAFYKHEMQHVLYENEKKYRAIFENANEAICVIQDELIRFFNPITIKYFGYSISELNSLKFIDLVHEEDKDLYTRSYTNLINGNHDNGFISFRVKTKNHNIRWLKLNSVKIDWENKPATLNFLNDITEQRMAEEEIAKFKIIFDNANYGITSIDENGRIEYINKYYANVLGYDQQEVIGKKLSMFYHNDQQEKLDIINQKLEESGSYSAMEVWHIRKDGSVFPMLMNGNVIMNAAGQKSFTATSAIDITDRKKYEQVQSQLFEELEDVNDELQNFAYVVSHDLKAPLRAISTLANWISTDYSDKFDDEGKEQIHLLMNRVKRMHDLIDGILEYSRVGRINEEKVEVDLNESLKQVIDIIAPPSHIKIKVVDKLPTIYFEATRISQVFQNLLSNAIKFMDKPKGKIKIGCKTRKDHWEFYVSDNGPGIEEKHFSKIFKIFQTLQPRDEFESTGIGLTLIKKIITMYEGKIWLESKVGESTTFYFTLPFKLKGNNSSQNNAWKE
jgi:PAS domain S-box-containing protein